MTDREAIDVLFNEWKCIDRNDGIHCDRKCESCDLVMDVEVIREAYSMAISALQAQEAKNSNESSLTQKGLDTISRQAAIDALDKRGDVIAVPVENIDLYYIDPSDSEFDKIPMEQTAEILKLRKDLRGLPSTMMTNKEAINLLRGLEQSLDGYCELNDEGKKAFNMAVSALELFGNTEQLPSAQFKGIDKEIHEITESDKISYAIICAKFPSPHVYFSTYDEAARWARFNQPNYRPYYIIERSEHFEIVGEVR